MRLRSLNGLRYYVERITVVDRERTIEDWSRRRIDNRKKNGSIIQLSPVVRQDGELSYRFLWRLVCINIVKNQKVNIITLSVMYLYWADEWDRGEKVLGRSSGADESVEGAGVCVYMISKRTKSWNNHDSYGEKHVRKRQRKREKNETLTKLLWRGASILSQRNVPGEREFKWEKSWHVANI